MSYKTIINKNSILTTKFLEYLANNPKAVSDIPSGVSYVVFSANDKTLNKYNLKLVEHLRENGKKVVKATETKNEQAPWELNYLAV